MSDVRSKAPGRLSRSRGREIDREVRDMMCPVCGRMMHEVSEAPGQVRYVCLGPCTPQPENDPEQR